MKTKKIVLLTGFEPFGGESQNPSQQIVEALHGKRIAGHRIVGRLLPVAFGRTQALLRDWIDTLQPSLVLALGQAGGRSELSLERIAINLIDARIPDNDGEQPVDTAIIETGPHALFAALPLKRMLLALHDAGIPAALSQTAGTYVCNQVFYLVASLLGERGDGVRGGFIHVPWLPQQVAERPGQPSMALETMVSGVRVAIETCLANTDDVSYAAGTTH